MKLPMNMKRICLLEYEFDLNAKRLHWFFIVNYVIMY